MLVTKERILLDPITEDAANDPLDITGQRHDAGHGIYLESHSYPKAEKKTLFAGSIDSRGERRVNPGLPSNRVLPVRVWVAEESGLGAVTNLMPNPSFEKDSTGWASYLGVGSNARSRAWRKAGEWSLKFGPHTATANALHGLHYPITVAPMAATAGRTYRARVVLKGAQLPVAPAVYIDYYNAGAVFLGQFLASGTTSLEEQLLSVSGLAPANTAFIDVIVLANLTIGQTLEFCIDAVQVEDVTGITGPPLDYLDGDTPGCEWTGTPHASSSTRKPAGGKRFTRSLYDLERKIEKMAREGGTYKRILPSGDEITFDVEEASLDGNTDKPFNQARQGVDLEFLVRPEARGAPEKPSFTITDNFAVDTLTNGPWVLEAGANIGVSGGHLTPTVVGEKQLYRRPKHVDSTITFKFHTGASAAGYLGIEVKRLDLNNKFVLLYDNLGVPQRLELYKVVGGVLTQIAQGSAAVVLAANTDYWIRTTLVGNVLTAAVYAADPAVGAPAALQSITYTLSTAEAAQFGEGIAGNAGIRFAPAGTDWWIDDFTITSNTYFNATATDAPVITGTISGVKGSLPGRGKLGIDEAGGADRAWVVWGVQSLFYDSSADAALFYEAESRTPLGGAAIAAGPAGASGSGSNVMRQGTLTNAYQYMLSTQALAANHLRHVGRYRVFARLHRPATNTGEVSVRFEWGEGDFRRVRMNDSITFDADEREGVFTIEDLGLVTLGKVVAGTQRWEGRIAAKSTVLGDDLDVDWIALVPVEEGYGEIRAPFGSAPVTPSSFSARDEFDQTAGNLNAKVLPVGGSWATSGTSAADYQVHAAAHTITHAPGLSTFKAAIAGATNYSNCVFQADMKSSNGLNSCGMYVRWVDANNYVLLTLNNTGGQLAKVVAGVSTTLATFTDEEAGEFRLDNFVTVQIAADSLGRWVLFVAQQGEVLKRVAAGQDSVLATGGALATGKPGLYSSAGGFVGSTHTYDNFWLSVPIVEVALFANQSAEIRHDRVIRRDSAGALWTPPSDYEGDYFWIPPSGKANRSVRFIAIGSRGDPEAAGVDSSIDDLAVRVDYTPLYDVVPDPT